MSKNLGVEETEFDVDNVNNFIYNNETKLDKAIKVAKFCDLILRIGKKLK